MTTQAYIEKRCGHFVALRDWVKAQEEKHKLLLKPAREEMEKIKGEFAAFLKETGLKNGATSQGSFYIVHNPTCTIADKSQFWRFVQGGELWDLIDYRANANAVEEFIKQNNGELPPGVNFKVEEDVRVNRPK